MELTVSHHAQPMNVFSCMHMHSCVRYTHLYLCRWTLGVIYQEIWSLCFRLDFSSLGRKLQRSSVFPLQHWGSQVCATEPSFVCECRGCDSELFTDQVFLPSPCNLAIIIIVKDFVLVYFFSFGNILFFKSVQSHELQNAKAYL